MPDHPAGTVARWLCSLLVLVCLAPFAHAQANYEIQVYGAETVGPQTLMVELHSNFTVDGQKQSSDGVYPTNHQEHETIELTQGLNDWSEVGFSIFTSEQDGHGVQWVGPHSPAYSRTGFLGMAGRREPVDRDRLPAVRVSTDTWTWEIRPIIDKSIGRWYFAVNPALERTFHGPDVSQGFGFAPSAKISYDFTRVVSAGIEWYADYGAIRNISPVHEQQQQVFAVADLNVSPVWEINFGVGIGATSATDHLIVKAIVGRRIDWGRHSPID